MKLHINIDTSSIDYLYINNQLSSFSFLEKKLSDWVQEREINIREYTISNKYLRAIVKKNNHEYHILEKPSGINNIICIGSDMKKKTVKIDMPYTVMIIKLLYLNGKYQKRGDRIFHTDSPVNSKLSNSLWQWGLSNVYEANYICWGSEQLPNIDNQSTYRYVDEFFLGAKNKDLLRNPDIDWSKMNTTDIHSLSLAKLSKLNFKLNEVIGMKDF